MYNRARNFFAPTAPIVHTLRLRGVIQDGRRGGTLSIRNLEKALEKAFDVKKNKRLAAVAVSVNSPGGSPVQSELIAGRMTDLSRESGIPFYTFAEDVAASGGYWLLSAGHKSFCAETSLVGSIGVVTGGFGFPDLIEKIGVERRILTAGENKARNDPFKPVKAEDEDKTREILTLMHELFKAHVQRARGDRLAADRHEEIFSGDVWLGDTAVELGLVDDIKGDPRAAMREMFGQDVELRPISVGPQVPWPFSQLQAATGQSSVTGERLDSRIFQGAPMGEAAFANLSLSVSVDSLITAAEERALWGKYQTW